MPKILHLTCFESYLLHYRVTQDILDKQFTLDSSGCPEANPEP